MGEYYAKQGHNLKDQESKERKELNDLWNHEQVKKVFKAHEKSYRPIFKQFAILDQKQEIGGQMEESQMSMNSTQFLKFCAQHGLKELSGDEVTLIFRAVNRDKSWASDDSKSQNQLGFEDFQRAILRTHLLYTLKQKEAEAADKPLQRQSTL